MVEGFQSGGMTGVAAVATEYAAGNTSTSSKYVKEINIDGDTGMITAVYQATDENGLPSGVDDQTITFSPYAMATGSPVALDATATGSIDWGCSSATHKTADDRGLTPLTAGTLLAKYAPAECR
ncbi:MAG: pilin [Dokdonella sp.]|nr:pilin [Dokdonella sp.]